MNIVLTTSSLGCAELKHGPAAGAGHRAFAPGGEGPARGQTSHPGARLQRRRTGRGGTCKRPSARLAGLRWDRAGADAIGPGFTCWRGAVGYQHLAWPAHRRGAGPTDAARRRRRDGRLSGGPGSESGPPDQRGEWFNDGIVTPSRLLAVAGAGSVAHGPGNGPAAAVAVWPSCRRRRGRAGAGGWQERIEMQRPGIQDLKEQQRLNGRRRRGGSRVFPVRFGIGSLDRALNDTHLRQPAPTQHETRRKCPAQGAARRHER